MSDHNEVPVTSWVLDKVVTEPVENLPAGAAIAYFVVAGPLIGLAAVNAYGVDELNHLVVQPTAATLEKLAEITGDAVDAAADGVDEAVHETASVLRAVAESTAETAKHAEPDPATTPDGAMHHVDPSATSDPATAGEADDGAMCHADPATAPDPVTAGDPYADAMSHPDPASVPDQASGGDAYDGAMCPADPGGGDPGTALQ